MADCDFHDAAGDPDRCTGSVSGGGDWPWACDGYVGVVERASAVEAWQEIDRLRADHRAGLVAEILGTLSDWLYDGGMPCGCRMDRSVMCADHGAMVTT